MERHVGAIMNNSKIKVLYIAGTGRSGSTIVHNILGQIDGFSAVGELRYIWERGFIKNALCGCGVSFQECEFWRAVVREAFGGMDHAYVHRMSGLTASFRIYHLPLTLISHVRQRLASRLSEYLDSLEKLYRAIQTTTGSRVIVDSSKFPQYGYAVRMIPVIELYVVHLTRDSRAVAYSRSRKRLLEPDPKNPEYMEQENPIRASLRWNARNLTSEMHLRQTPVRYMMLRYEDFIDEPEASVKRILSLVDETAVDLPFVTEHAVEITKTNHSVFGNVVRFQTGTVELKLDKEWKMKMRRPHKIAVLALTWPLLLKYGYLMKFHNQNRE